MSSTAAPKKQKMQLLVATEALTCQCCGGTIPVGHKYWYNPAGYFSKTDSAPVEHTNCELYMPSISNRGSQRHVS